MNLLSTNLKSIASGAINNLFDSFSRNITIYKTPQRVIISEGSGYNFAFGNTDSNVEIENVILSGVFPAKIKYDPEQERIFGNIRQQDEVQSLREMLLKGRVKVTVRPDAHEFLKDCEQVQIDGKTVRVRSDYRPHFPFGAIELYNYYFEAVQ